MFYVISVRKTHPSGGGVCQKENEHKEFVINACIENLMGYELPMQLMKNDGTHIHPIGDIYVEDDDFYKCYEIAKERLKNLNKK